MPLGIGTEKAKAKGCTCFRYEGASEVFYIASLDCKIHKCKSEKEEAK